LYRRLEDITVRIGSVLGENDARAITGLTEEHRCVMDSIKQAGLTQDPGLLDRIKETYDQVHKVISEIDKRRDELCGQLVKFERKKKVAAAYAGDRLSIMSVI
jgi:hypothetical protein